MTRFQITNQETGEVILLSRDAGSWHPYWVHQQLETENECELQTVLDSYAPCGYQWIGEGQDDYGVEPVPDEDRVCQTYQMHPVSGELYVFGWKGLVVIGVCGPIEWREATATNLDNFECDPEDAEWAFVEGTVYGGWRSNDEPYPGDR
jgi:hypothetical protein